MRTRGRSAAGVRTLERAGFYHAGPGHAVSPAGRVAGCAAVGRATKKPGNGAVASFTIPKAGSYRIGSSNGAWIDVVRGGKALPSRAHGHGPLCTGLRKMVSFTLARGTYALQLSAMPAPETKVMIVAD